MTWRDILKQNLKDSGINWNQKLTKKRIKEAMDLDDIIMKKIQEYPQPKEG